MCDFVTCYFFTLRRHGRNEVADGAAFLQINDQPVTWSHVTSLLGHFFTQMRRGAKGLPKARRSYKSLINQSTNHLVTCDFVTCYFFSQSRGGARGCRWCSNPTNHQSTNQLINRSNTPSPLRISLSILTGFAKTYIYCPLCVLTEIFFNQKTLYNAQNSILYYYFRVSPGQYAFTGAGTQTGWWQ